VRRLARDVFELDEHEHLWHSENDPAEESEDSVTADDFTELNRHAGESPLQAYTYAEAQITTT